MDMKWTATLLLTGTISLNAGAAFYCQKPELPAVQPYYRAVFYIAGEFPHVPTSAGGVTPAIALEAQNYNRL